MRFHVRIEGSGDIETVERALELVGTILERGSDGFIVGAFDEGAEVREWPPLPVLVTTSPSIAREIREDAVDVIAWTEHPIELAARFRKTFRIAAAAADHSVYRKILDACPITIFAKSVDGTLLYANGTPRGQSAMSRVPPAAARENVEEWTRDPKSPANGDEFVLAPRTHGWRKTTTAAAGVGDEGRVVVGVVSDLSVDRAKREELELDLAFHRNLLNSIPALIVVTDEDARIVLVNPIFAAGLGREAADLSGSKMEDLFPDAVALAPWRAACVDAESISGEIEFGLETTSTDGIAHAWRGSVRAMTGPSGQRWTLTVASDVSALLNAQREAESARASAVAASRVKSQFLANMSHEIRTPMNGVLGMLELALATDRSSEQREYLEGAHVSAESLLTIINDILDISKIEAGKLTIENISFSLQSIVDALGPLRIRAKEKGLTTKITIDEKVGSRVMGDPVRFRQILTNLVGNAIKFTKQGGIDITIGCEEGALDMLHVMVSDTGIGIPEDQQAHVFQAFRQADETTTRKFGGTGLGLSICRELSALMGGKLWVESVFGSGSAFHFTARMPTATGPSCITTPPLSLRGSESERRRLHVLLAEDNVIGAKFAKKVLELEGCDVVHVADGDEAVKAATSAAFDLILMDMQMPVLDGLAATTKIRELEAAGRRAPIHALTANAMKGDAELCIASGMDGYLAKPLERALLQQLLDRIRAENMPVSRDSKPARVVSVRAAPAVDIAKALERCGGDQELLGEVACAFQESVTQNLATLDAGVTNNDGRAIHKAAHALKGVFVYLSADSSAGIAESLCIAGRDGEIARAAELIKVLRNECAAVKDALDSVGVVVTAA